MLVVQLELYCQEVCVDRRVVFMNTHAWRMTPLAGRVLAMCPAILVESLP
jgi:hypothetical protein